MSVPGQAATDDRAIRIVQHVLGTWPADRLRAAIGNRSTLRSEIGLGLVFFDPSDPDTAHIPAGCVEVYAPAADGTFEEAVVSIAVVIEGLAKR